MAGESAERQYIQGLCTYNVSDNGFDYGDEAEASGTGFAIAANGYIATCAHLITGARVIDVTIGGKKYRAKVAVQNEQLDLAILKIQASNLPVLQFGNSDSVRLAESVRAFGFPLSSMLGTDIKSASGEVSGIVMHPKYGKQIQTDAPINPGNSGGPIVNDTGQVIGIASSGIAARFASSIGFAVPINELKKMITQQGLDVPAPGAGEKLAGPELAKKVTPAVALINIKGVLDGHVFEVKYTADYTQTASFSRPQIRFDRRSLLHNERDSGTLKVNRLGEVVEFQGENSLPFQLGPIAELFLEPVGSDGNKVWHTEREDIISIVKKSGTDGVGPNMGPGRLFGPTGGRFPGTPRNPLGRDEPEETVIYMTAIERAEYKITEVKGDRVTIRKNYQFVTQEDEELPYLCVKGVGTFVFDRKIGMPATMTYRATITKNSADGTSRVPLNVSYERKDPELVKRQREEARARTLERNRNMAPILELAKQTIVPEKREEVMETGETVHE